jgi:hypothetical protein
MGEFLETQRLHGKQKDCRKYEKIHHFPSMPDMKVRLRRICVFRTAAGRHGHPVGMPDSSYRTGKQGFMQEDKAFGKIGIFQDDNSHGKTCVSLG